MRQLFSHIGQQGVQTAILEKRKTHEMSPVIVLDLYRKLQIKQRSEYVAAYMSLPWSSCYSANTDNRSQRALRDIRVPVLARKEKPSESQEKP